MVDDSKEKDKGKKTLKRGLTLIVKKLKSIESTFRETSRPNHKQERWPLYQSKRQQLAESNPDTQKEIFSGQRAFVGSATSHSSKLDISTNIFQITMERSCTRVQSVKYNFIILKL